MSVTTDTNGNKMFYKTWENVPQSHKRKQNAEENWRETSHTEGNKIYHWTDENMSHSQFDINCFM